MTTHFLWDDEYDTGDANIDAQHQMIFDAANMFVDAIRQNKEIEILDHAFELLLRYTQTHFTEEEAFYENIGSLLLEEQIKQHIQLMQELKNIWQQKQEGSQVAGQALSVWMEKKLIPHIVHSDTLAQKSKV